jgi:putative hydrolase of HD superfamily
MYSSIFRSRRGVGGCSSRLIGAFGVIVFLGLMPASVYAQKGPEAEKATPPAPLEVVHAYVDAANRGDLEGFISLYAPDIRKFKFPATEGSRGRETMRAVYAKSFAEKKGIHVEILEAMTLGDKVVCRDRVTGLPDGKIAEEIAVYQVQDGLITNIVYVERILR